MTAVPLIPTYMRKVVTPQTEFMTCVHISELAEYVAGLRRRRHVIVEVARFEADSLKDYRKIVWEMGE